MKDNQKYKGRRWDLEGVFLHWNHNVYEAAVTVELKDRDSSKMPPVCRGILLETFDFSWKKYVE